MKNLLFILLVAPFLSYSQLTSFVVRGDTLFALDPSSGVYTQLTKNVPPMAGQSGKILSTSGSLYQWITPSYVNVSDSASMLSPYLRTNVAAATYQLAGNYLTGNQSITLSGDISGSGTTAITTAIGSGKVTNAMLAGSIAYSKLSLTGAILNADLAGSIADAKISSAATWNAKQNAITTGTTAQYFRGDLSLATFPTTTAPFANSTDKNFVTDAQATVIGNTSGTNTGDNAANTTYANDYRLANFVAGTNYLAPGGNGSGLSGLTASQVGLGNVTNESKATMFTSPTFTGTPTGIGIPTYARVTGSDATTTGQALTNITGLSVALTTNAVYEFEAVLGVTTSAVTTGTQYAVQYSVAGGAVEGGITGPLTSTAAKAERIAALNTATSAYLTTSAQTGQVIIKGIITTGANAGNLTIQHLKVTSGTSTIKINSFLKVTRIS